MAAIPFAAQVIIYPKDKSVAPYPATIAGFQYRTDVSIGGGPIIPPGEPIDPPIQPPLEIWPPPGPIFPVEPHPEHPIVLPDPPVPPDQPPATPTPPHEGWNWSAAKSGWYYLYIPGQGEPGPKK